MKYVVGYNKGAKFITLYECNNVRLALLMAKAFKETRAEEVIIKKRGLYNEKGY